MKSASYSLPSRNHYHDHSYKDEDGSYHDLGSTRHELRPKEKKYNKFFFLNNYIQMLIRETETEEKVIKREIVTDTEAERQ